MTTDLSKVMEAAKLLEIDAPQLLTCLEIYQVAWNGRKTGQPGEELAARALKSWHER